MLLLSMEVAEADVEVGVEAAGGGGEVLVLLPCEPVSTTGLIEERKPEGGFFTKSIPGLSMKPSKLCEAEEEDEGACGVVVVCACAPSGVCFCCRALGIGLDAVPDLLSFARR